MQDSDSSFEAQKNQNGKRTRKAKYVPVPLEPTRARITRRAKREQSQSLAPQVIPRTIQNQLICFTAHELEITRLVLQVPLGLFGQQTFLQTVQCRVEKTRVEVKINKQADNLVVQMKLAGKLQELHQDKVEQQTVLVHGKYSFFMQGEVHTKVIKSTRKQLVGEEWSQLIRVKLGAIDSDMFLILTMQLQQQKSEQYQGLVNQGNTCYMNSYLQMLFHLTKFRQILFSTPAFEKDKFPATLQLLFYRLLTQSKPVSPQQLVRSFGWSKRDVAVQQDAQEFSCLFFEALQNTIDSGPQRHIGPLFCGELVHYIRCLNINHRNQNYQRFYDLQLPIAPTLAESLDAYVSETQLDGDNQYRSAYGLQDAAKGLALAHLPPILMVQLKRFQFNYRTQANEKIMEKCQYPQEIDFAKWTTKPHVSQRYHLYSVLVHQGCLANSGHYYVFVKNKDKWYKFNDQRVEQVSKEKALDYNFGGQSQTIEYQTKQMKVHLKNVKNRSTAYMLVYVSNEVVKAYFQEASPMLPEWIVQHTKDKAIQQQCKKQRKGSICDLFVVRWNTHLQHKQAHPMSILLRQSPVESEQKLDMVLKNLKVQEWLFTLALTYKNQYPYLYWTSGDKEILMSLKSRQSSSVQQLFKETVDPMLFVAPIQTQKQEFLVMVKLYEPKAQPCFQYSNIFTIEKTSTKVQLYRKLHQLFPNQHIKCYIEDRDQGLTQLQSDSSDLLPSPSPSRNQLLVVAVQLLSYNQPQKLIELYRNQLDTVSITLRQEGDKEGWQRDLNKYTTVHHLRQLIFEDLLQKNQQYVDQEHIIIKYKGKKAGKHNQQAKDEQTLLDLIKYDKNIFFLYSSLKTQERVNSKELEFYCRKENTTVPHGPFKAVIDRKDTSKIIIQQLIHHQNLQEIIPNHLGLGYRILLLSKDQTYINDVANQQGWLPGDRQLSNMLEKERSGTVLVQQFQKEDIGGPVVNVLIHHITKTGEKLGYPRCLQVPRSLLLSDLKMKALDLISFDTYLFQGKAFNVNPMKVRVLAFLKDVSRGIQLPDPEQFLPESEREQQEKSNAEAQQEDRADLSVQKQEAKEEEQGTRKFSTQVKQEQSKGSKREKKKPEKELIPLHKQTIADRYSQCRYLRLAIMHSYIVKTQKALKLNID